jgi:hypothetical protein
MSKGKILVVIGVTGLVVGVGLFILGANQAVPVSDDPTIAYATAEDHTVAYGTMFISLLTTLSGIFFQWRGDRRADRELEARMRAVEGKLSDQ